MRVKSSWNSGERGSKFAAASKAAAPLLVPLLLLLLLLRGLRLYSHIHSTYIHTVHILPMDENCPTVRYVTYIQSYYSSTAAPASILPAGIHGNAQRASDVFDSVERL